MQSLGEDNIDTACTLHALGCTLDQLEDYGRAQVFFKKALYTRQRKLGAEHDDTVDTLWCLAAVYRGMGRESEADALDGGLSSDDSEDDDAFEQVVDASVPRSVHNRPFTPTAGSNNNSGRNPYALRYHPTVAPTQARVASSVRFDSQQIAGPGSEIREATVGQVNRATLEQSKTSELKSIKVAWKGQGGPSLNTRPDEISKDAWTTQQPTGAAAQAELQEKEAGERETDTNTERSHE